MATATTKTLCIMPAYVISSDPETMGGTPVFRGTRVHIRTLFDYLDGEGLEMFLDDFPTVSREQAQEAIHAACRALLAPYESEWDARLA